MAPGLGVLGWWLLWVGEASAQKPSYSGLGNIWLEYDKQIPTLSLHIWIAYEVEEAFGPTFGSSQIVVVHSYSARARTYSLHSHWMPQEGGRVQGRSGAGMGVGTLRGRGVLGLKSFLVSWFLGFKVSQIYQICISCFSIGIDPISHSRFYLTDLPHFFGGRLFKHFKNCWVP